MKIFRIVSLFSLMALSLATRGQTGGLTQNLGRLIEVGPNVHVSRANEKRPHGEVLLASDPNNAARLLGCSMIFSPEKNEWSTVVYVSSDSGKSWRSTLLTDSLGESGDPACGFGPDGAAYFAAIDDTDDERPPVVVYRSRDGGNTWLPPAKLPGLDREYVVVDDTGGKFNGRIYIHGTGMVGAVDANKNLSAVTVFRSRDGGAAFEGPVSLASAGHIVGMGNSVVLSDGTLAILFGDLLKHDSNPVSARGSTAPQPNALLKVVTSEDGGESFSNAAVIESIYRAGHAGNSNTLPYLAADRANGPFKDRLYAVWPDRRSGRLDILFSFSSDKGKTWAKPIVVNDDRSPIDPAKGPDHFMPVVAVNREGVLGVMWYDRRESLNNLDWAVRFAASLDGGETFLTSVKVSEGPFAHRANDGWAPWAMGSGGGNPDKWLRGGSLKLNLWLRDFQFNGGHTAGLAADANGVFHPFWIDNRTGVSQVWTASVIVKGKAIRNGSPDLAVMEDVSGKLNVTYTNTYYDRASGILSVDAQIENTSEETILAPVKLRVLSLKSDIGMAKILGAENGEAAAGAVLDFTGALPDGRLRTKEKAKAKRLEFKLSDSRPLRVTESGFVGLIRLNAKALGKVEKKAP